MPKDSQIMVVGEGWSCVSGLGMEHSTVKIPVFRGVATATANLSTQFE